MEVVVLKRLQNCSPHICVLLGCGRTERINYMVITLLGPNLSELRKQQPKQKFSLSTTLRVGVQVIAALRAIHDCGFLHRDIKPSNFAIGASSLTRQTCYMLDFGLARQFMTSTGEVRPPRPVAGFRGTVRYASINAHQSKDLGRHDDLWSVFYLLIELVNGELPWKKIRDKEKAGKFKQNYDHKKLLKRLPAEFYDFLDHLKSLNYFQEPNYVLLSTLLQNAIHYLGIKRSDPLDWEHELSVQSLTTMSVGSAPALQTNDKAIEGKSGMDGGGDLRTNVSTDECLSQNATKKKDDNAKIEDLSKDKKVPKCGATVPSKQPTVKQGSSMPPSPLLQATHLLNNDPASAHADSLDRFFDMRVGDGRSQSKSCESSSRSRRTNIKSNKMSRKGDNKVQTASNSLGEKSSSVTSRKCQHSSRTKSSSDCHSKHQVVDTKVDTGENIAKTQSNLPLAAKVNNVETPKQTCSSDDRHNSEFRYLSLKQGESDTGILIHPDTTPAPKCAYTANHTASPLNTTQNNAQYPNLATTSVETRISSVDSTGEFHNKDTPIATSNDRNSVLMTHHMVDQPQCLKTNDGGTAGDKRDKIFGETKRGEVDSKVNMVEEKDEDQSSSESSGFQHRLFARGIQSEGEQVKYTEVLPLEMMQDTYSPGPPPLEFNSNRPQEMWGHDSTSPMSLIVSQGVKITESSSTVIVPRPPDHPPPKHYTLLAARRRRFRRPGNT